MIVLQNGRMQPFPEKSPKFYTSDYVVKDIDAVGGYCLNR
jgi:hypothetical protein